MEKIESHWRSRDERPKDGQLILVYRQATKPRSMETFTELNECRYFNRFGWEVLESGYEKGKVLAWLPVSELNLPEIE